MKPHHRSRRALAEFGQVLDPTEAMEPILAAPLRGVFLAWLTEIWAEDALAEVGVKPRLRSIFDGPPGTGKTTLAHHLSARLGMPMLCVRPETIIDSWVGSSARNMGAMFNAIDVFVAENGPLVVFFDEFDSLGAKRRHGTHNPGADAQHNEMVNTFLARIEAFGGIVIAATNHASELDPAIWRRFELHVHLPLPEAPEIMRILALYLKPFALRQSDLRRLAEAMQSASPALMRQFCEAIKRNIVVGPLADWDMRKEATIDRILEAVRPHPDLGKPRLWSHGSTDIAIRNLPWPLSETAPAEDNDTQATDGEVVSIDARRVR